MEFAVEPLGTVTHHPPQHRCFNTLLSKSSSWNWVEAGGWLRRQEHCLLSQRVEVQCPEHTWGSQLSITLVLEVQSPLLTTMGTAHGSQTYAGRTPIHINISQSFFFIRQIGQRTGWWVCKDIQTLMCRAHECHLLHGKENFTVVITRRIFSWEKTTSYQGVLGVITRVMRAGVRERRWSMYQRKRRRYAGVLEVEKETVSQHSRGSL